MLASDSDEVGGQLVLLGGLALHHDDQRPRTASRGDGYLGACLLCVRDFVEGPIGTAQLLPGRHLLAHLRILHHRFEVGPAAPLGIIRNPQAVFTAMKVRRNEARQAANDGFGRATEMRDQFVRRTRLDRKHVDENDAPVFRNNPSSPPLPAKNRPSPLAVPAGKGLPRSRSCRARVQRSF